MFHVDGLPDDLHTHANLQVAHVQQVSHPVETVSISINAISWYLWLWMLGKYLVFMYTWML